ncbi:hypothetical protein VTI74DRAFT_7388 [Chaetomium olivicolor]
MIESSITGRARWQRAALWFCCLSLASFLVNLSFTIWASNRSGARIRNGVGVFSEDLSCAKSKDINTGIHVVINVLSTILLAGSHYCMQCLSAPTREQIDQAHRDYNSAIFTSISSNEYSGTVVTSFMTVPDEHTTDMCLASKETITSSMGLRQREPKLVRPSEFRQRRKFAAASGCRWALSFLLYVVCIAGCLILFFWGRSEIPGANDPPTLLSLGLGALSSKTLIQSRVMGSSWGYLLANVIMANSPQIAMSLTYFTYNSLFTSISLATEWDSFARNRKGLRVSARPAGAQRSTHFLQLPYRYSIPLLVVSGVLHWLISQSIFLVFVKVDFVEVYAGAGTSTGYNVCTPTSRVPGTHSFTTCGWSPAGLLAVIVVAMFMVCFVFVLGCRRLGSWIMPVAGSCSAAVSAACHPVPYDQLACFQPLQWGVASVDDDGIRHCSFSSGEVEEPKTGQKYS